MEKFFMVSGVLLWLLIMVFAVGCILVAYENEEE